VKAEQLGMTSMRGVAGREIEAPYALPDSIHVDEVAIAAQGVLDIGSVERVSRRLRGDRFIDAKGYGRETAL
jgi:hypothetical protein